MRKYELKASKEEKQMNNSMLSANQYILNIEEMKKKKISAITDFNKKSKESRRNMKNKVVI